MKLWYLHIAIENIKRCYIYVFGEPMQEVGESRFYTTAGDGFCNNGAAETVPEL
jgi:hypothetical protein